MFTSRQKADEAKREVGYRQHVYPRLVVQGRMTGKDADRKIAIMTEIANDYRVEAEAEEAKERLL